MPYRYHLPDGTGVPGVTTVCKVLGHGEGMLYWANKAGLEGKSLSEARMKATTVGTVAHALIEAHAKGEDTDLSAVPADVIEQARCAYDAWRKWSDRTGYVVTHAECELTSSEHLYGGRFDAVIVDGERLLADWKTSAGIYPDHLLQLAAYGQLWNENHPDEPLDGYLLLRLGKEEGTFDHHYRPARQRSMRTAWEAFKHCRELYDLMKTVKKGAR